jgi:hypothetical protein
LRPQTFKFWRSISLNSAVRRVLAKLTFFKAPFEKDVLAAVRYLKAHGSKTVAVVGGSLAEQRRAMRRSRLGQVRLIASYFWERCRNLSAEKLKSRALFIVARDDGNGDYFAASGNSKYNNSLLVLASRTPLRYKLSPVSGRASK